MKFKILYTLFFVLGTAFLLLNSSNGRASVAGEGNTGAPGDNAPAGRTCLNCHNGGPIQVTLDIEVADSDGNLVTAYIPNQTYSVKVRINDLSMAPAAAEGFGFQMISLVDDGDTPTNSWSNPSGNVNIVTTGGRSYAEHFSPSNSNEFLVEWTAPASGSGNVTFYAAGNGVNLNGNTGGDGAAKNTLTLTEDPSSDTQDLGKTDELVSLYPNPAVSTTFFEWQNAVSGTAQVSFFDAAGRVALQQNIPVTPAQATPVEVANLAPGLYWVQIRQGQLTTVKKFVKR